MRVAGNTVVRRYIKHLESNLSNKNESEQKINSNRSFNRASENPINAAKALRVRKAMAEIESYQDNLGTASSIYSSAEGAVMNVSSLIQSSYEKLIYGANGTQGSSEDTIIADSIETFADEMVRVLNLTVADRKIFGGTNNSTNAFTVETSASGDKTVFYNGEAVNKYQDPVLFPSSNCSYTDIGIGMTTDTNNRIDQQTALPITFNGAELIGCGLASKTTSIDLTQFTDGETYSLDVSLGSKKTTVTFTAGADETANMDAINTAFKDEFGSDQLSVNSSGNIVNNTGSIETIESTPGATNETTVNEKASGYANNVIQLVFDAAACLRSGDKEGAAKYADQLMKAQTLVSLSIAEIGNKEEFIEFNQERLTNNMYSLQEQQNEYEATDLGTEITNWKVMESVYDATLQMSASVISKSFFDFL